MRVGLRYISCYTRKLENVILLLAENTVDLNLQLSVFRIIGLGDLVYGPCENAPRVVNFRD